MGTAIGLGLSAASALWGGIQANKADKEADRLRRNRPEYEVPSSQKAATDMYQRKAAETLMPGQTRMEEQIKSSTAQGITSAREGATTGADLLGATTSLYGSEIDRLGALEIEAARNKSSNELLYAQSLGVQAGYEDKAFEWNEARPYQTQMNELQAKKQAGYNMLSSGIGGLTNPFAWSNLGIGGGGNTGETTSPVSNQGLTKGLSPTSGTFLKSNYNW